MTDIFVVFFFAAFRVGFDFRPISVIITMLASLAYVEVVKSGKAYDNEFDLILDVIELMPHHIETNFDEVLITNPTMKPENYAEKWNRVEGQEGQKYRKAFYAWHSAAVDTFDQVWNVVIAWHEVLKGARISCPLTAYT